MSTIVGVMDRPGFQANTDNLVLVEPACSRLTWIPRDLWCETLRARINCAFNRGGHALLVAALEEHGFRVTASLVLSRDATEEALADVVVTVPVPCRMVFSYPLTPRARIESFRQHDAQRLVQAVVHRDRRRVVIRPRLRRRRAPVRREQTHVEVPAGDLVRARLDARNGAIAERDRRESRRARERLLRP